VEFSEISILGKNARAISDYSAHPILTASSDGATRRGKGLYSGDDVFSSASDCYRKIGFRSLIKGVWRDVGFPDGRYGYLRIMPLLRRSGWKVNAPEVPGNPGGRKIHSNDGIPGYIRSDNRPELCARALREWLNRLGVTTLFIEPGSPWENGHNESVHSVP